VGVSIGGVKEVTEAGLALPVYDYVSNASGATSDTYSFYRGGSGGLKVATVAIVYYASDKATIQTVTKTEP
jgi:hypothetical protein